MAFWELEFEKCLAPWTLKSGLIYGADGHVLMNASRSREEVKAIAQLISVAPELLKLAIAANHALRSYQYGNSSTELAEEMADALDKVIAKSGGATNRQ